MVSHRTGATRTETSQTWHVGLNYQMGIATCLCFNQVQLLARVMDHDSWSHFRAPLTEKGPHVHR